MKKIFFLFLGFIVCGALLTAQTLEEALLGAAVNISRELPANATVAVIHVRSDLERLNDDYVMQELYGAILRNRQVVPVKPDQEQMQNIRNELGSSTAGGITGETAQRIGRLLGVQYLITGTIERSGAEYRILFTAVDTNAQLKSQYSAVVDPQNDPQLATNKNPTDGQSLYVFTVKMRSERSVVLTIDDVEIGHFFDGATTEIVVADGTHIVRAYQKEWNEMKGIWEHDGDNRRTDTLKGEKIPIEVSNGPKLTYTRRADVRDNWISGTLNILPASILGLGIGASYERMLGSKISLGANFLWTHEWLYNDTYMFGINVPFRFYPGGKTFFLGAALGFYYHCLNIYPVGSSEGYDYNGNKIESVSYHYGYSYGMVITPEIGWKIDVGKPGGLYVQIGTAWPFSFGVNKTKYRERERNWDGETYTDTYTAATTDKDNFDYQAWTLWHGRVYFGMGYAF